MEYKNTFDKYTNFDLSSDRYNPLTFKDEREALAQYANGSTQAFEKLVNSHLRFVVYMLRDYRIPLNIDIMDLIQEGNCGLIEGIKRFNPDKFNCKVFTYCRHWIKLYINKFLLTYQGIQNIQLLQKNSRTVYEIPYKCPNCDVYLVKQDEDEGISEGISEGTSGCVLFTCPECDKEYPSDSIKIKKQKFFKTKSVSLEGMLEDNTNDSVKQDFPDSQEVVDYGIIEDIETYAFKNLTAKEKTILNLLLGFTPPYKPKTLKEVGSMLHLHTERIRVLANTALEKIDKEKLKKLL